MRINLFGFFKICNIWSLYFYLFNLQIPRRNVIKYGEISSDIFRDIHMYKFVHYRGNQKVFECTYPEVIYVMLYTCPRLGMSERLKKYVTPSNSLYAFPQLGFCNSVVVVSFVCHIFFRYLFCNKSVRSSYRVLSSWLYGMSFSNGRMPCCNIKLFTPMEVGR